MYIWKHIEKPEYLPNVDSWEEGRRSNKEKKESFIFSLNVSELFQTCAKKKW